MIPTELHQRSPLICGSIEDVELAQKFIDEDAEYNRAAANNGVHQQSS